MIYKKSLFKFSLISFIFLIIILTTTFIFLSLYDNYIANENNILAILNILPEETKNVLKIDIESFNNIIYYYLIYLNFGSLLYLLLALILGITTIKDNNIYLNIFITKVFRTKHYLKIKIYLALASMFIFNLLIYLILIAIFRTNFYTLFLIQLALYISMITIYFLSLVISTFLRKYSYLNMLVYIFFIILVLLSIVINLTGINFLTYICPICYFDYLKIVKNGSITLDYLASMVIIVVFSFNLSLIEYGDNHD